MLECGISMFKVFIIFILKQFMLHTQHLINRTYISE